MSAPPRLRDLERALADLPPNVVGEILFGRLVTQPRPAPKHAVASSSLGAILAPPFQRGIAGPGDWIVLDEPELQLGPHVLVPDVAAWRRETMPEVPETARIAIVPDWVCEVLSPSTEAVDRHEKKLVYGANGVGHLWFVDPVARALDVHRSERGEWTHVATFQGDAPTRIEPFDAIEFPLAWLWSA